MAIFKARAKTKRTGSGARYKDYRKKKLIDLGRQPSLTAIGAKKMRVIKGRGFTNKFRLLVAEKVNLFDPKTKKYSSAKITAVVESPSNSQYVRRNIITKGAIVQTDKGKAKITSRPGQHGVCNAVLVA